MTNHIAPEYTAPPELRCEALAPAQTSPWPKWAQVDRQCSKKAQQMREGIAVCYAHALIKQLRKWK